MSNTPKNSVKETKALAQQQNNKGSVMLSALGMGAGTLLSRVLGLVRDALLAGFFSKTIIDVYAIGFRLPNFFRRVMGEGALSVSFIPNYLELKVLDEEQAKKLRNIVFSFLFTLSGTLSLLGILFLDKFLHALIFSGQANISKEHFDLAVSMGRWMFAYLFLVTQFAYFMSVLNAHKRFWVAGVAPAFFNLGFIAFIFFPDRFLFFSGQQLALGVLFGGLLQVATVGLSFFKLFGLPKFYMNFKHPVFKRVLLATVPSLLGIGVLQIISLININFCARIGEGANGFLYLADRIMELPQSLIAVSLGTAMLPSLSELWTQKNRSEFDKTLVSSLRIYLYFSIPAGLGLWFLALPITQLLFERGQFTFDKSMQVASLVQIYGILLIISGMSRILLPIFYSFKNTWYPAVVAVLVLAAHYFVGNYLVDIWGLSGVAAATTLSSFINFALLLMGLKMFIQKAYVWDLLKSLLSFLPPVLLVVLYLFYAQKFMAVYSSKLITVVAIVVCVVIYYIGSLLFKVDEAKLMLRLFKKIVKRS